MAVPRWLRGRREAGLGERRPPGRDALSRVGCVLAVTSTALAVAAGLRGHAFVGQRQPHRKIEQLHRRFFRVLEQEELGDGESWEFLNLVETNWRMNGLQKDVFKDLADIRIVDIEPENGDHIAWAMPKERDGIQPWSFSSYTAVGRYFDELDENDPAKKNNILDKVFIPNCDFDFLGWEGESGKPWPLKRASVDVVTFPVGAVSRLQGSVSECLREAKRVLKPHGRLFLCLTNSDMTCLQGSAITGAKNSLLDRCGFKSKLEFWSKGSCFMGYAKKKSEEVNRLGRATTGFKKRRKKKKKDESLASALGVDDEDEDD